MLNQASFGATEAEADRVISMRQEAWIDEQMTLPKTYMFEVDLDSGKIKGLNNDAIGLISAAEQDRRAAEARAKRKAAEKARRARRKKAMEPLPLPDEVDLEKTP